MTVRDPSIEKVAKAALLGTGRESSPVALEGALQPFGEGKGSAETTLLNAATALLLSDKAGQLPSQSETPAIALCSAETQPYFSPRGVALLDTCLSSQRELTFQALRLAARSGRIAPPSLLPRLLELGAGSKAMRPSLAAILGERGRWLAQLNPEWRQIAAPLDENLEASWQEGESAARREALRSQRELDPAQARVWVEAAFKTEGAKERVQWLETLEDGLSQEDEPFLESALDDKSKEVRAIAVSMLKKLPDSKLVSRAKAEAESLLKWNTSTKKAFLVFNKATHSLEVELPAAWKKEWARDGLEEKVSAYSQVRNLGEKASWLREWVSRIPPSHWEKLWGASPAEIWEATPPDWQEMLAVAWWDAAKRHGETAWLLALVQLCNTEALRRSFSYGGLTSEQSDLLAQILWEKDDQILNSSSLALNVLHSHPGTWSLDLSRRYLKVVRDEAKKIASQPIPSPTTSGQGNNVSARLYGVRIALSTMGDKFPIEMAAEAAQGWPDVPEVNEQLSPAITGFLARLQLRADLQAEFQPTQL